MQSCNTNFRASFYTLGCRLNQAETSLISNSFRERGYEIVDYGEPTDVCVINTCTVTQQADAKCRQLVRQVLRRSPDAFVAVIGCYAQIGTKALQDIEGIDLIVGTEEKMQVCDFIDVPQKLPEPVVRKKKISSNAFTISSVGNYETATRANLKIQDGCDFMCTFCVIPFARGRSRSRAFWDIQREAMQLVERGHKELVLSGVNIGTYAYEGKTFLDVVKMLETVDGLERIRISSIEPTTIPQALVYHMAESDKLCNHFHIPLQSGDDNVLKDMRRLYTLAEYEAFLKFVQKHVPEVCFGTDVMVGFPGESEERFENSLRLLSELPLAYFHVFPFSERDGTRALKMTEKVDARVKKSRSATLRRLSVQKRQDFYQHQVGKTVRVLMEERNEAGLFQGFTENYVKVGVETEIDLENQFFDVELTGMASQKLLVGSILSSS
ncbi:MAG: tRNA (N(6)-L-threonylcarbamoyladenosine(37)-C(2))-methylthiotransferase MtaB [Calditrichaeota bacterium]|nr:tRNA (N(6)-L-threonylcarbamoyladenosine(37)-C(2))-methylthiotransferase MtaB [Calditrichota bacterium]